MLLRIFRRSRPSTSPDVGDGCPTGPPPAAVPDEQRDRSDPVGPTADEGVADLPALSPATSLVGWMSQQSQLAAQTNTGKTRIFAANSTLLVVCFTFLGLVVIVFGTVAVVAVNWPGQIGVTVLGSTSVLATFTIGTINYRRMSKLLQQNAPALSGELGVSDPPNPAPGAGGERGPTTDPR